MTGEHWGTAWGPVGQDGGCEGVGHVCLHVREIGVQARLLREHMHDLELSLLYITWQTVHRVAYWQCHPVQLNVNNVTYTHTRFTIPALFYLPTSSPFPQLLLTVSVPNDQCQLKVLTQGREGRDPLNTLQVHTNTLHLPPPSLPRYFAPVTHTWR